MPNHLLGDYLQSLLAVLLAQFSRKGFPGGMQGVVRLVEKSAPIQVCHHDAPPLSTHCNAGASLPAQGVVVSSTCMPAVLHVHA